MIFASRTWSLLLREEDAESVQPPKTYKQPVGVIVAAWKNTCIKQDKSIGYNNKWNFHKLNYTGDGRRVVNLRHCRISKSKRQMSAKISKLARPLLLSSSCWSRDPPTFFLGILSPTQLQNKKMLYLWRLLRPIWRGHDICFKLLL
jgi:hypothetical protein